MSDSKTRTTAPNEQAKFKFVWFSPDGREVAVLQPQGQLVILDVIYAAEHPDELDFWVKTAAGAKYAEPRKP